SFGGWCAKAASSPSPPGVRASLNRGAARFGTRWKVNGQTWSEVSIHGTESIPRPHSRSYSIPAGLRRSASLQNRTFNRFLRLTIGGRLRSGPVFGELLSNWSRPRENECAWQTLPSSKGSARSRSMRYMRLRRGDEVPILEFRFTIHDFSA